MYYEHKEFFCQYPFDIGIWLDISHNHSIIRLSSCNSA